MEKYTAVINELASVIENPGKAREEKQELVRRDIKALTDAVDDKSTNTADIMLMVRDIIILSEEAAYLQGISDGLRLKI